MKDVRDDMTYLDLSDSNAAWPVRGDASARVLLLGINFDDYYSLPIRILALGVAMQDELAARFDVRYMEWGLSSDAARQTRRVVRLKPDILGLSVNVWNRDRIFELAAHVKKRLPHVCVVAGGQEMTNSVVDYLAEVPALDYVIDGEGEVAFRKFLEAWDPELRRPGDAGTVPGIVYRAEGQTRRVARPGPLTSLDGTPSVVLAGLVPLEKTRSLGVLLESTRGCPFRCSFCFEAAREGKPASASMARLRSEIEFMVERGVGSFHMMDPILCNSDPDRLRALSRVLSEAEARSGRPVKISVEAYGDQVTEELAGYLGGSAIVDIGLQSTNPRTLKEIHRHFSEERFCEGVSYLRAAGASVNIYLITGLPFETFASSLKGIRFAMQQRPTRLFLNELSLLNGTELRRRADEYGYDFDPSPPYLVKSSKWITALEMSALYRLAKDVERRHNLSFSARPLNRPILKHAAPAAAGRLCVNIGSGCAWSCPGCRRATSDTADESRSCESLYAEAAGKDIELRAGDGVEVRQILNHAAQFQLAGAERIALTAPPSVFVDGETVGRMVAAGIWQYRTFIDFDGAACGRAVFDLQRAVQNVKLLGGSFPLRGRGDLRPYVNVVALLEQFGPGTIMDAVEMIRNEVEAIHLPGPAGTGIPASDEELRAIFVDAVESSEEVERMNKTSSRFRTAGRDYWPGFPEPAMRAVLAGTDGLDGVIESLDRLGLLACDDQRPPCFMGKE